MLNNKTILITGGTGSFGKKCTEVILKSYKPKKLIIFSRDEFKQSEMAQVFSEKVYPCLRYFIGNVRDKDRLNRAFDDVEIIIHAAALKQVPTAEYNPLEAIKTNIIGASNIIDAAIDRDAERVIALSTDKAANPINLYGATKLCSDKLFVAANAYSGKHRTRFSVVRYGNVIGSRGSVIPLFLKMKETGVLQITDKQMTRFWITLEQGAQFVLKCLSIMRGGEIFVPKLPSMNIMDLAKAIAPNCKYEYVGFRPGERSHEVLIPEDDARRVKEFKDYFVIEPNFPFWDSKNYKNGRPIKDDFKYSSDNNNWWLTKEEIRKMIKESNILK